MNETEMQHGQDWHHSGQSIDGWLASEKFDGCRAEWDGGQLWTRGGNIVPAPAWFTDALPKGQALSGEIWAGRGRFQSTSNAVRYGGRHFSSVIRFVAFDAPLETGDWTSRVLRIESNCVVCPVRFQVVESVRFLREMFDEVKSIGGEGLVIRRPSTTFATGRTFDILKVKDPSQFPA